MTGEQRLAVRIVASFGLVLMVALTAFGYGGRAIAVGLVTVAWCLLFASCAPSDTGRERERGET